MPTFQDIKKQLNKTSKKHIMNIEIKEYKSGTISKSFLDEHKSVIENRDDNKIEKVTSVDYKIEFEVTEIIKTNKQIKREMIDLQKG